MNTLKLQRKIFLICFLFIPVLLLLTFVVYPAIELFHISFTDWNGMSSARSYIGFDNYMRMFFNSSDVWSVLKNNWIYFYVHALFIPLELMVAIMLHNKMKGSKFFKTVIFMPYIMNGVAVSYAFAFFYSPINGGLNGILNALGLDWIIQNWLSNKNIVNYSLTAISLWRFCGLHIVLFLAGLQSIPKELIEASVVDGANALQRYLKIIIPSITRVVQIILFLNVRGALQVFDIPFVVTRGGPMNASSTFTLLTMETAFQYNDFGMASTMAITLLFIIILMSWIQDKLFKWGWKG
ncbi:MAG: sugar ABC transporter permease [Firmicutes bacterium]|nr:sugar ABC transporter permease [Bacillota bacterium]